MALNSVNTNVGAQVALQNLPVTFMMDRGGLAGPDGPTHHGVFDLGYLRVFPNMVVMSPGDATELPKMLDFAMQFDGPCAIRYPKATATEIVREAPAIELRLQEMFGVTLHPVVGQMRLPLRVTLLSPGQKPLQVTMDIPGFWRSSYADVRKDMRGQYPRHPWPEDPTQAEPTLRAKPRGT